MPTDDELQRMMEQATASAEFPPEERKFAMLPWTPGQEAAWEARVRSGYYTPGVGAFDWDEGVCSDAFTVDSPHPIAFHIGDGVLATQQSCAACGSIVFHLGAGKWHTAFRCANCGREWGRHNG